MMAIVHLRSRRCLRCAAVAVVLLIIAATPMNAFAAMDATLSSTHARSGDAVLLLTEDHSGTWDYSSLSTENNQRIYLALVTAAYPTGVCDGPAGRLVGELQWRGNAGGVAFMVPSLSTGDYWLFMQTRGQCWRIAGTTAGGHGPLVLSIGIIPANNQEAARRWTADSLGPSPRPAAPLPANSPAYSRAAPSWLGMVVLLAVSVLLATAVTWLKVRARQ